MCKKLMKYVVVCAVLAVLCGTAQANLLLNAGFETNGGGGGAAANWTNTGATGTETWAWHTGDWGMAVYSWGGWEGCPWPEAGTGEFYQDVAVSAGTYYEYTIWATRDAGDLAGSITMKIEWYGDLVLLGTTSKDITTAIGHGEDWPIPNWVQVNIDDPVAPPGSDMARVMISTHIVNRALKFDDASFDVPEPATMTILALGSLFLARRRK